MKHVNQFVDQMLRVLWNWGVLLGPLLMMLMPTEKVESTVQSLVVLVAMGMALVGTCGAVMLVMGAIFCRRCCQGGLVYWLRAANRWSLWAGGADDDEFVICALMGGPLGLIAYDEIRKKR